MHRAGLKLVAATIVLLAGACGTAPRHDAGATSAGSTRADSLAALETLFRDRLAADRARFTEADVRFMSDMIAHHAQAIAMARMAAPRGASPEVQALASRIRAGQEDEVVVMQQWLRERGQAVPDTAGHAGAHAHAHGGHAAMPGMLSAAQFAELDRARDREFDTLFLTYMIEHHRGAVVMVDALLASDGAAQDPVVFRMAADIHAEQTAEIGRMQRMLLALFGRPGSQ